MYRTLFFLCGFVAVASAVVLSESDGEPTPCQDTMYLRLLRVPVDSMTAGAAIVFAAKDRACADYRQEMARDFQQQRTRWEQEQKGKNAAGTIVLLVLTIVGLGVGASFIIHAGR